MLVNVASAPSIGYAARTAVLQFAPTINLVRVIVSHRPGPPSELWRGAISRLLSVPTLRTAAGAAILWEEPLLLVFQQIIVEASRKNPIRIRRRRTTESEEHKESRREFFH
jgi:hypothetical protein